MSWTLHLYFYSTTIFTVHEMGEGGLSKQVWRKYSSQAFGPKSCFKCKTCQERGVIWIEATSTALISQAGQLCASKSTT